MDDVASGKSPFLRNFFGLLISFVCLFGTARAAAPVPKPEGDVCYFLMLSDSLMISALFDYIWPLVARVERQSTLGFG